MTAKRCRTRLAFSNAVARSGMGLTFLTAPFTQLLIDTYGWQGEHSSCPMHGSVGGQEERRCLSGSTPLVMGWWLD